MDNQHASFFEGTEKKVELYLQPQSPSLRERGQAFWASVVQRSGAQILSKISNDHGDAYLLSESSLFVYDHKMIMITCGRTRLPDAVLQVLDAVGIDAVELLTYERKNEVFPHQQPTSFFEDVATLTARAPGKAFQFGDEDEHHLYLFHLDRPCTPNPDDRTVEVLMYDVADSVRAKFGPASTQSPASIRREIGLDPLLHGYTVDDHRFQPSGYSLNAIRGPEYLTVHVTPDDVSSYVSVETNQSLPGGLDAFVQRVTNVFRPRSFDVILWEAGTRSVEVPSDYRMKARVEQGLSCGYTVTFLNFYRPQRSPRNAVELPIEGGAKP